MKAILVMWVAQLAFIVPQGAYAEINYQEKARDAMTLLKEKLNKHGAVKINGEMTIGGKKVGIIYFGNHKVNENYTVVDEIRKEKASVATVFVKAGEEYIRVSTNVLQDDGNRAIGTLLARNAAYEAIKKGEAFYGPVDILGKPYETGYEPIKNSKNETVGIYFVGYLKRK